MKHFKRWTHLTVVAVAMGLGGSAHAGGSSGGYGSSGGHGSSGGYGSSGSNGSSGGYGSPGGNGSSGGYAASYGSYGGGSSGGGGLLSHLRSKSQSYRGGGSSGGSSGGYAAASYGSSGGAGHVGPFRRLAAKIQAHHAARYSASSGGYAGGSSGGSSGGYATSMASYSGGSSGGSVGYVAPMMMNSMSSPVYESPVIQSSYQSYPGNNSYPTYDSQPNSIGSNDLGTASDLGSEASYASAKPMLDDDAALLTVAVPNDSAKVTVNGHATTSEGSIRQFMSRGLKTGYIYTYVVNVVYTVDGKEVVDSKSVKLRPGDTEQLVFEPSEDTPEADDQATAKPVLETVVELHVPENADVTLAGNPTKGQGAIRTFRTKQLKAGESWKNYTVSVTAIVDGRSVTKQRSVDVNAGDQATLDFDFASGSVAAR